MSTIANSTLEENPKTVAQLAISHPGALAVFTKYNIDYCCGGHRSIEDACMRIGLDPEKIKAEIFQSSVTENTQAIRPETWTSSFLVDYIIQNHHSYIRNAIPEITALLDKVCNAHGHDCHELLHIRENFFDLTDELLTHMQKEELVLFPAIKNLESQNKDRNSSLPLLGPVDVMEKEHELAGDLVKEIRTLSNNYTPPDFACPTFRITFNRLQEFDNDLMKHIHLENNILFERLKDRSHE